LVLRKNFRKASLTAKVVTWRLAKKKVLTVCVRKFLTHRFALRSRGGRICTSCQPLDTFYELQHMAKVIARALAAS